MKFKEIIDNILLRDTEERNPDGLTFDEFVAKYPESKHVAYLCWNVGCYPEELKKELAAFVKKGDFMMAVKQEDIAWILKAINNTLEEKGYLAVGYDNTGEYLDVLIEKVPEGEEG